MPQENSNRNHDRELVFFALSAMLSIGITATAIFMLINRLAKNEDAVAENIAAGIFSGIMGGVPIITSIPENRPGNQFSFISLILLGLLAGFLLTIGLFTGAFSIMGFLLSPNLPEGLILAASLILMGISLTALGLRTLYLSYQVADYFRQVRNKSRPLLIQDQDEEACELLSSFSQDYGTTHEEEFSIEAVAIETTAQMLTRLEPEPISLVTVEEKINSVPLIYMHSLKPEPAADLEIEEDVIKNNILPIKFKPHQITDEDIRAMMADLDRRHQSRCMIS